MIGKLGKLLLRRLEKLKFIAWCTDDDYWVEMIPEVLIAAKIFLVLKMDENDFKNGLKVQPAPHMLV